MPHTERIDRLAALLVRYVNRFRRGTPVPAVDRRRIARLRLAIAQALNAARNAAAGVLRPFEDLRPKVRTASAPGRRAGGERA